MTDEQRFDDESPQPFEGLEGEPANRREIKAAADVGLEITPWANVQVEERKIDRRGFKYVVRRLANGAGVSRTLWTPVFDFYASKFTYRTLSAGIGNRYVVRLGFEVSQKERVCLRLDMLKLIDFEFNVWWPGA